MEEAVELVVVVDVDVNVVGVLLPGRLSAAVVVTARTAAGGKVVHGVELDPAAAIVHEVQGNPAVRYCQIVHEAHLQVARSQIRNNR